MSISTQRTLAQLSKECQDYGLTVVPAGNKITKTDYVLALRDFYIKQNYPNGIPQSLELMLQIDSPMLCQRYTVLNPPEQENIWNSPNWILEQKEDGARMMMVWLGEWDFYSRNISVTDFLPVSYRDNFYFGNCNFSKIKDQFILDSEIVSTNSNISTVIGKRGVVTESQLQAVTALMAMNSEDSIRIQRDEECPLEFRAFDVIWWNGEWIMDKPLIERVPYLLKAIEQLNEAGMRVRRPYSNFSNKRAFYKTMISSGNEGCIAKNLLSPYIPTNSRRRDGFVKIKRTMSESSKLLGLNDTIDAFVSGFEPADEGKSWAGLVGALEFSVYLRDSDGNQKVHKIAKVANITQELRESLTEKDANGDPILKQEWYGKVASIDGQCVSARSHRLKHAVLVQWRPDRSEDTCIVDKDFLESMVL